MRLIYIVLVLSLLFLQHKLWLGDGSLIQWFSLEKKLATQEEENHRLMHRNKALEVDISELKRGDQALEEQARNELGMVKDNEVYYQFIN